MRYRVIFDEYRQKRKIKNAQRTTLNATNTRFREQPYGHNPQVLQVYLYYRLIIASVLLITFAFSSVNDLLGKTHPGLFKLASSTYMLICLASIFAFPVASLIGSFKRIAAMLIIDLFSLLLMIHASDGLSSSLSYLLLINVAMASIFIRGQLAFAYASLASLFILAESFYFSSGSGGLSNQVFSAGTLGILIFLTSISFNYLTTKIRQSDTRAAVHAQHVKHLQQLAQHIVTRMRTGIVVIDEHSSIELINESALQLLDLPKADYTGIKVTDIADFGNLLSEWRRSPELSGPKVHPLRVGQEVRISFARLETEEVIRTILYMEDYRSLAQQAQQIKLASLGRLTASIAHEVRNPLGAISHASQLLSEADYLQKCDMRLIEIILQHSERVNQIIENTLTISRRKEPKPITIELAEWLPRFINEYQTINKAVVGLSIDSGTATAKFDPTHLNQVLTNLCDNGVRFSQQVVDRPYIAINAGISENDDTAFIEVVDEGPGVKDELLEQIFDPFYTTDLKGSGLGLYISRELCEINQASLYFKRVKGNKSCFRIDCTHHQRII